MIVPTGIGGAIGGYAGDALPVARAFSSVVDCLITHPNVLNAAMLYWPMSNVLYVEGYALDRFAEGLWALEPVHQNRVGLVLDAGIEEDLRTRHLQVVDAARASLGLSFVEYTVTDLPLMVEKWVDPKCGQSTGRIQNPDSLLRAVEKLIKGSDVNAVAVVARFPDDDDEDIDDYRQGMVGYFILELAYFLFLASNQSCKFYNLLLELLYASCLGTADYLQLSPLSEAIVCARLLLMVDTHALSMSIFSSWLSSEPSGHLNSFSVPEKSVYLSLSFRTKSCWMTSLSFDSVLGLLAGEGLGDWSEVFSTDMVRSNPAMEDHNYEELP
nr:uncharacterized lipoprotein syc1174_c-like [Ipomoea batatas]